MQSSWLGDKFACFRTEPSEGVAFLPGLLKLEAQVPDKAQQADKHDRHKQVAKLDGVGSFNDAGFDFSDLFHHVFHVLWKVQGRNSCLELFEFGG
jgi:hypothetical protein